jgi:hypothetical protein
LARDLACYFRRPAGADLSPPIRSKPPQIDSWNLRLTKLSAARQAVVDAVRRTADFKNVEYTQTFTFTSATLSAINSSAQVSATRSPVMVDTKSTSTAGKKYESILNGANHVLCIISEGSPDQRLPGQPVAADAADPFNGLVKNGANWKFLDDVDLNGHKDWHVMGDIIQTQSQTFSGPKPNSNVNTSEVWIDSRSGKIEKRLDHATGAEKASKYDRTTTDTDFVYDSGVTITPCQ